MVEALWITLIGMGLVFAAIVALWGLMALLVWITARYEKQSVAPEVEDAPGVETPAPGSAAVGTAVATEAATAATAAAAAAVAVAMAMARQAHRAPEANPVSAWQAVQRAGQLGQHDAVSRKKVLR